MRATWVVVALVLLVSGCEAPEEFLPPSGSVQDPFGVYVVRRDNPFLHANVELSASSEAIDLTEVLFVGRKRMEPSAAYITDDRGGSFDWSGNDRGWLWTTAAPGAIVIGGVPILAPAIRLPVNYEVAVLRLIKVSGPELLETQLDAQAVVLDSNVLVLPVRVTMFIPELGGIPSNFPPREAMGAIFEPGAVSTTNLSRIPGGTSPIVVDSGRFLDDGSPNVYTGAPPDNYWTQCDIQFRLEQTEFIRQQYGLEDALLPDCRCGFGDTMPDSRAPVTNYIVEGRNGNDMLQIFLGGTISGTNCGLGRRSDLRAAIRRTPGSSVTNLLG
jgi:hypothetical protein